MPESKKTVVAALCGREYGIKFATGYVLEIEDGTIVSFRGTDPEWTDSDLRRDALLLEDEPVVGQPAPSGWQDWRR